MPGIPSLLNALDQNDIGDIAGAVKEDPTLLQPPKKGMAGELATAANNLTQFFGLLFNDDNALKVAQQTKVADEQRDFEAIQQKLIPVIAEGRSKRLEQARQDKLDYQKEQMEQRRAAFLQGAMDNYAWQNDDGSLRTLTAEEAMQAADSALHFHDNPQDGLEHKPLPKNLVVLNQVTKQKMLSEQQDKMLAKRDADMAARSEAAAKRAEGRANDREDTRAKEKAEAEARAARESVVSDWRKRKRMTQYQATQLGKDAAAEVAALARLEADDAVADPAAWQNTPYLRDIFNTMDKGHRMGAAAKARKAIGESGADVPVSTLQLIDSAINGK